MDTLYFYKEVIRHTFGRVFWHKKVSAFESILQLTRTHQLCSADGNLNESKSVIIAQDKAWGPLIGSCLLLGGSKELIVHGNASLTVKI